MKKDNTTGAPGISPPGEEADELGSMTAAPEDGLGTSPVQDNISFEETMASSVEGVVSSGEGAEAVDLAPGDVIDASYQIVRRIGEGGMGAVYEARDLRLGRLVAIKCVTLAHHDATKNAGLLRLFRRDATATAQLSHPNVITIYDFGTHLKQPFLVLELLSGQPLDKLIDEKAPLPFDEAIGILQQICAALAHAHKAGIVHRDLKPGNVFVLEDGMVKVLDFGMAELDTSRSLLKAALQKDTVQIQDAFGDAPQGGSPGYMAPEQWRDNDQDARSDVWSMGILLYELLTQKLPFDWRKLRAAAWGLSEPLPIEPIVSSVPEHLQSALRKALAWNVEDRTESAAQFATELEEALVQWRAEMSGVAMTVGQLDIGSVIEERYKLTRKLGQGGFGVVYEAEQSATGQSVAIKVLHPQPGSTQAQLESMRDRFEREMKVIASIKHPNIVRLIDSGKLPDGQLYIVLEFVEGKPLSDVLEEEGSLSEDEARHLMIQVLDALSSAHEKGLVHRDLKPDNIMVTRSGARRNAMVLDFGIAGVVEGSDSQRFKKITATNEIIGTPSYMAPEQLKGAKTTPQTDIYAWGLVFLECLTGETAVDDVSGAAIIYKQLIPDPVPIPEPIQEGIFGPLIARATQKELSARFPSGLEALEALQATAGRRSIPRTSVAKPTHDPSPTRDPSLPEVEPAALSPGGSDPLKTALIVLGVLVTLAVIIFAVLFLGQDEEGTSDDTTAETQPPPETTASADVSEPPPTDAQAAAPTTPPEAADTSPPLPAESTPPPTVTVGSAGVLIGLTAKELEGYQETFGINASFDLDPSTGVLPESAIVTPDLEVMTHEARGADWIANAPLVKGLDGLCPDDLPAGSDALLPVTGVSAVEAQAFCESLDMRLPTIQEWEAIARGSTSRPYSFDGALDDARRAALSTPPTPTGLDFNVTPEGVHDLTGSVWEWATCPPTVKLSNCKDGFALKGGSYKIGEHWWLAALVGTVRETSPRCFRRDDIGFRCVKETP